MSALAAWLLVAAADTSVADGQAALPLEAPGIEHRAVLGADYPLDGSGRFHVALLHWVDSLADLDGPGATAGKTVAAHREEFTRRFGPPAAEDGERLRRYAAARRSVAASSHRDALTVAFFEAPSLAAGLDGAAALLDRQAAADLRLALVHFAPRYRAIWDDGREVRRFLERAAGDPRHRALGSFLRRVAEFFDVPPDDDSRPQLHIVPVPAGYGTHAQALGRHLLVEIRPGEGLLEEVPPIVHENAHYLFYRMDPRRRAELERRAASAGGHGVAAWRTLLESLPTAIGQGVAAVRFLGEHRTLEARWYHTDLVDAHAKLLYPLVRKALDGSGHLDEEFLDRAIALWPAAAADAARQPVEPTLRSP